MLHSHTYEQSITYIGKPERLQKLRKIERHQTLIHGVTMMYLMFKVCRKSILITTATILRNRNEVRPNRTAPQRCMNSLPLSRITHQYIKAVPMMKNPTIRENPKAACVQ